MAYIDLNTIHNPETGTVPPASWGDAVRDNFVALRGDSCLVAISADQSIPDTALTNLTWDTEISDLQAMHSIAVNTDRINILRTGIYLISVTRIRFVAHATGYDYVYLVKNATPDLITEDIRVANAAIDNQWNFSVLTSLTAGDYVAVRVKQTSGGALNIDVNSTTLATTFGVQLVQSL